VPIPFERPGLSEKYDADMYMFRECRMHHLQKRSLLPRRCYISEKPLWFKRCVVVESMIAGPADPVYQTFWCDRQKFLLYELKRID